MDKTHHLKERGIRIDNFKNSHAVHKCMLVEGKKKKKTPIKKGIDINFHNLAKDICKNPTANIIFSSERLCSYYLWSGISKGNLSHNFYETS